jgi:hypothetical protein
MLVIVKICKKWRHYIKNIKYSIRMIIDHANLKNFFINKAFSRKKVKWWKRLIELNLRIKYRSEKNNFADDSSRKRDYEDEIAKKNKNNENLNLRKWILIESKNILKSKNEKKKKSISFRRQAIDMLWWKKNAKSQNNQKKKNVDKHHRRQRMKITLFLSLCCVIDSD